MEILHMFAGPIIGAVIGYCTNYIAVKMLFKPLNPVYIFGKQLPFTPGVIPKNKGRMARALGQAISKSLLSEKELGEAFLQPEAKNKVEDQIYQKLSDNEFRTSTPEQLAEKYAGEEKTASIKAGVKDFVAGKIADAVAAFDLEGLLSTVGVRMIMEKIQGSMLAMFLNENTIMSFIQPIAGSIRTYLDGPGREKIAGLVSVEVDKLCQNEIGTLFDFDNHADELKEIIGQAYEKAVEKLIPVVIEEIDIAGIVEKKIDEMDVGFLEDLILSIMKNELDYVVRIGAVIGFVIGCVNIFI